MPDRIVFDGDLVRVIREEILHEARLEDVLPQIEHRPPIFIGMLPKTSRFVLWDESDPQNKRAKFLAELEPGLRNCDYGGRAYRLAIPWTYFLFEFQTSGDPQRIGTWQQIDSRVYWAQNAITGLDSEIGRALVPNCNTAGSICYGSTGVDVNLPLSARVDRLVHEFYRTTFTHDSGTGSPWGSETGSTNWDRWERESRNDPVAWQRFPEWPQRTATGRRRPGTAGRNVDIAPLTVRQALEDHSARATIVDVQDRIPEMIMPATFGRTEEWLRGLTVAQRLQIATGITNINAANVPAPAVAAAPEAAPDGQEA